MNETQAELVEWEQMSPQCWALKLRGWDDDVGVEGLVKRTPARSPSRYSMSSRMRLLTS